jgi:hypothetical protein
MRQDVQYQYEQKIHFAIKKPFNMSLKVLKILENFILVFEQINPCELTLIINERNIIIIVSKGGRGRAQT